MCLHVLNTGAIRALSSVPNFRLIFSKKEITFGDYIDAQCISKREGAMPNTNSTTVVVTGGAGFIGSHLVEELVLQGYRVRVLDNFSTGRMENLDRLGDGALRPGRDFELIQGDIRDAHTVNEVVHGAEVIFHQAALGSVPRSLEDPLTTHTVNADGTLNIFWAARSESVRRVVYASSSSVYGDSESLPKREGSEGRALSPYALTKKINEEYGRLFKELYGIGAVGLRYFNVYGPRQDPSGPYAAVIPRFTSALLAFQRPLIYGTGRQSRDFTFVGDVVKANLLAMEAPREACGAAYNIGRGDRTTVADLLDTIQSLLGTSVEPRYESPRPGDVEHSLADVSAARKMLGFAASTELRAGLELSMDWYRSQQKK
jgi:UDP-N-acetylglucosamine 4-epimerase